MHTRVLLTAIAVALFGFLGALTPHPVIAATLTVGQGPYACDFAGLSAAVDDAAAGDTVTFDCPSETIFSFADAIEVDKQLIIQGENAPVFDGADATRLFIVEPEGDLTLRNLQLQRGHANIGGAILSDGRLELDQVFAVQNAAQFDGGAIFSNGQLTIVGSRFDGNQAGEFGGAVLASSDANVLVGDSAFAGNEADASGGAIADAAESLQIELSRFEANRAGANGGAILTFADAGSFSVIESRFERNVAGQSGGAIHNNVGQSVATVLDSTFDDNDAAGGGGDGGAIFNGEDARLAVENSAIVSNSAGHDGGAIASEGELTVERASLVANFAGHFGGAVASRGQLQLSFSTLANNIAGGGSAVAVLSGSTATQIAWSTLVQPADLPPATLYLDADLTLTGVILDGRESENCAIEGGQLTDSFSLSSDDSCGFDGERSTQNVANLALGELSTAEAFDVVHSFFPLSAESPAVDAGGSDCGNTDQVGRPRPLEFRCDIGAIESDFTRLDPVDLCANRWNGELRLPNGSCSGSETLVEIPADPTVVICANLWNGDARYSSSGACNPNERPHEAFGLDTIPICINRWNGSLRVSDVCSAAERSDAI